MTVSEPQLDSIGSGGQITLPPRWTGAIAGVVAAMAGLAVAELVAGLFRSLSSPVVSVGDRVIDGVPRAVKEWAIDSFGTADKPVLLGGVLLILAGAAATVGIVAQRRGVRAGYAGVGLFAAVGVIASIGRGGNWASPIPSCIAGVVTAIVLTVLIKQSLGDPQAAAAAVESGGVASQRVALANDRRRFLRTSAAVAASSLAVGAAGRWFMTQGTAAAERLKIVLPKAARPLPPVSAAVTVDAPGVAPFLTPNDQFYRIDTALVVPRVRAESWKLTVGGMVDQPITLTYEELLARPMIEADITIACVSNEVGGNLVGTARWLGCRLDDLLAEAGIQPAADQIVGRSVDGFTAGFPTALLDGRDALVAVGMNGEPLPARSGFPARLIVPGVYGYVSATKWLSEIQLTTFAEFEGYWIPRGWSVEAPVKTQSRIDTPQQGRVLEAGTTVAIAGVAWAPIRGIKNVEVRIDSEPWSPAQLGDEHAATTWRQWSLPWTPSKGNHTLSVRATDGTGVTQTGEVAEVAPDGATGWHTITVRAV